MPENKHLRFLLLLVYCVLGVLGGWFFLSALLPWLLPFLIALMLAWCLEKPVAALTRRCGLPRSFAAALCTLLLVLALGGALGLLLWRLGYEVALLMGQLPTLLAGLPNLGHALEEWSYRFVVALPLQLQDFFRQALSDILRQGAALPATLYRQLAALITAVLSAVPRGILFLFTTALATFFISAGRPGLLEFFARQVPRRWRRSLCRGRRILRSAFGGWLRAQGLLMLITFGELTGGFLLLRIDFALLPAALISLVDALPIFGCGAVLLPWAILALLGGDWALCVGLAGLYAVVSAVRSLLEPKLVGDRVGLPPLAALGCMYLGFSAFGVLGMIFAPLAAIFFKQLWDGGVLPFRPD